MENRLQHWLEYIILQGGSDLHLIVGHPPLMRLNGILADLKEPVLDNELLEAIVKNLCTEEDCARLQSQKNIDFSFARDVAGRRQRYRTNIFLAGGQFGACLRVIPGEIPELAWSGLPQDLVARLVSLRD